MRLGMDLKKQFESIVDTAAAKRVNEALERQQKVNAQSRNQMRFILMDLKSELSSSLEQAIGRLEGVTKNGVNGHHHAKGNGATGNVLIVKGSRKGSKLDMNCRAPGCKNRSGGPRNGFMCEEHGKKLSKKEQQAARDKYKEKHAA